MTFGRVAIVWHEGKPAAVARARELGDFCARRGLAVDATAPDLVVSLGGDGTMLRAAQVAHAADALLLGINLGALGYLTEVDAGDEEAALERILTGDFDVQPRMMLGCGVAGAGPDRAFVGLNEVLVERASRHRLVRLSVRVGGERLAGFNADGVLVATPTGSTAYALSAGGPLVSPRAECLVVVPVSAHMIVSRPLVLAPDEVVTIALDEPTRAAYLSLDGAIGQQISFGDTVVVERHPRPLKLVRLGGPGFIERMRVKLGFPG